jgi:outer membrane lipoprotein-sorting protein
MRISRKEVEIVRFRRMFVRMIPLAVWCSVNFGAHAADDPLQAVYAKMDQASASFKTLRADMKKVQHLDVLHEDTTDSGSILVKVPKPHDFHVFIDFEQPDKKNVELNGGKVQIYYPKSNSVQEIDLNKQHRAQLEEFVLLGFGSSSKDLQRAYEVKLGGPETVGGEKTTRIELRPKSQDVASAYPRFELWISDAKGISVQQKVYEKGEKDYSMATYSNMKINAPIADSELKLNIPKNAERQKLQ